MLQLIIDTFPLFFLLVAAFYSLRRPLEATYAFENSAKLWLIYIIFVTATPIVLIFLLSREGLEYGSYISQFIIWRSKYGLLAGLIYIIPWFLIYFLFLVPPLAAILFYFFSPNIFKKYGKLIPAEESNNITSFYQEPISLFEDSLIKVINAAGLPSKPKVYIKNELQRNCSVFGKNSHNFLIVVTIGLLESIKEGTVKGEELQAVIGHEVGHVLNSDLRLSSLIKIFSEFKIPKFVILGLFAALLLIYLSGIGLNLYYNQQLSMTEKLSRSYEYLKGFPRNIPFFLLLYIAYVAVDLLIRTAFRAREFFADAQAILTFNSEKVLVKTLEKVSSGIPLITPDSPDLALLPYKVVVSWPLTFTKFLFRIFFLPESFQKKVTQKIDGIVKKLKAIYSTHPSLDQRLVAIANHTYFPTPPIHISYKAYLTVGITVLISFLFLSYSILPLGLRSMYSVFLYFFYALLAVVIINNTHLRHLHKYDLVALNDGFFLCGFATKNAIAKSYGRKLFFANHLAHLSFTIFPLFTFIHGFPLKIFVGMLALQFLIIHISISLFLILLSWTKKVS